MEFTAKMLKEGRITIPEATREYLELEHGDYVVANVEVLERDNEE